MTTIPSITKDYDHASFPLELVIPIPPVGFKGDIENSLDCLALNKTISLVFRASKNEILINKLLPWGENEHYIVTYRFIGYIEV